MNKIKLVATKAVCFKIMFSLCKMRLLRSRRNIMISCTLWVLTGLQLLHIDYVVT